MRTDSKHNVMNRKSSGNCTSHYVSAIKRQQFQALAMLSTKNINANGLRARARARARACVCVCVTMCRYQARAHRRTYAHTHAHTHTHTHTHTHKHTHTHTKLNGYNIIIAVCWSNPSHRYTACHLGDCFVGVTNRVATVPYLGIISSRVTGKCYQYRRVEAKPLPIWLFQLNRKRHHLFPVDIFSFICVGR